MLVHPARHSQLIGAINQDSMSHIVTDNLGNRIATKYCTVYTDLIHTVIFKLIGTLLHVHMFNSETVENRIAEMFTSGDPTSSYGN